MDEGARILSAVVAEVEPAGLDVSMMFDGHRATVQPMLMNPRDSFELKFLVSNHFIKVLVDARIVGVREVRLVDSQRGRRESFRNAILILISLSSAVVGVGVGQMIMKAPAYRWLGLLLLPVTLWLSLKAGERLASANTRGSRFIAKLLGGTRPPY
jgi:hypothetical protein